jgi:polar amino acid transport system ATP-binding protein
VSGALLLEAVDKSFGKLEVLKQVDLAVAEHEVVCLIGASGSGKSTLLRCVNLLEPVDAGRILVEGEEITAPGVDVNRVRRRIGIVFQAFNLFPHMSVLDNITLAPRKVSKLPRAEAEEQARALLARFGLADKAEEFPDRLRGSATAGGDRPSARHEAPPAAARRGDERARPGARRRGAERDPRARCVRDDDGDRDA